MWTIDRLEINGGFLPGLKLELPAGLICIIGPRGSGKSTLAEAVRFALKGTVGASRQRLDLVQANIGSSGLVTLVAKTDTGVAYTIRRAAKQPAVLLSADGRTVPNVDLDRGTFLPLDAYNGPEIEAIADEALGDKRRALLDELRGEDLSKIHLLLGEHRRGLEANADRIRASRKSINDLSERIQEFGDVRAKLNAMGPSPEMGPSTEYAKANKQQQCNSRERKRIDSATEALRSFEHETEGLKARATDQKMLLIAEDGSSNLSLLQKRQTELHQSFSGVSSRLDSVISDIKSTMTIVEKIRTELSDVHSMQAGEFAQLQQVHQAADERYRVRVDLECRHCAIQLRHSFSVKLERRSEYGSCEMPTTWPIGHCSLKD